LQKQRTNIVAEFIMATRRSSRRRTATAKRQKLGSLGFGVGSEIPQGIQLHLGFPPKLIDLRERVESKNVIIMGLPGAFTPT